MTPADYLAELRGAPLLDHESLQGIDLTISPTNHDLHVGRTFAFSYKRLDPADALDALAIQLLARAACFAFGEPIPRDLLLASVELPDAVARRRAGRALTRLVGLGLLEEEQDRALRLHRLLGVGTLAADATALPAVEQAMLETANRLNNAGYPAPLLALRTHLRAIAGRASERADERAADLSNTFGYYLQMIGDLQAARPYYEQALAINRAVLGEQYPDTATSLNNLGYLLRAQGELQAARPYYEQALTICEAALGAEHPTTQKIRYNLAALAAQLKE
jgi:tetratricopeptide (TPR) repeat protein